MVKVPDARICTCRQHVVDADTNPRVETDTTGCAMHADGPRKECDPLCCKSCATSKCCGGRPNNRYSDCTPGRAERQACGCPENGYYANCPMFAEHEAESQRISAAVRGKAATMSDCTAPLGTVCKEPDCPLHRVWHTGSMPLGAYAADAGTVEPGWQVGAGRVVELPKADMFLTLASADGGETFEVVAASPGSSTPAGAHVRIQPASTAGPVHRTYAATGCANLVCDNEAHYDPAAPVSEYTAFLRRGIEDDMRAESGRNCK